MPDTILRNLAPSLRLSLQAKLERLLARPLIARVLAPAKPDEHDADAGPADLFHELRTAATSLGLDDSTRARAEAWHEDAEDGSCEVRIEFDYDDRWRGREKEVHETVKSTVEGAVTFLTDSQRALLEQSPRAFLALQPPPETAELLSFTYECVGGSSRIVTLRLAAPPKARAEIRHVAVVPNLVQIERQLDALHTIENAPDDGALAPLRALVGLREASSLDAVSSAKVDAASLASLPGERLDPSQRECIAKAEQTPHFAVIQGPPGSGKTTVIAGLIRRAVGRGERVLVVSPTHVAVDNVVEKLVPSPLEPEKDVLEPHGLPLRYAARVARLSPRAREYWVGSKRQLRGAAIARRLQRTLIENVPVAAALFAREDPSVAGVAPISSALAAVESVVCGTPIGVLSFESVKRAEPASYDLLIVDEVSKLTLPEFLAIAVKARRWVLVGDPEQLPPFNGGEENAVTLDDVLEPALELVCSVAAILERARPVERRSVRLVVVSSTPERTAQALRAHLGAVLPVDAPPVSTAAAGARAGVVVCGQDELAMATELLAPRPSVGGRRGDVEGDVPVLIERGLNVSIPDLACRPWLVDAKDRAQVRLFEGAYEVFHTQPWATRARQRLQLLAFRNGIEKFLPSQPAIDALGASRADGGLHDCGRQHLVDLIAERFAINTISVYDWLAAVPRESFDTSPLRELGGLVPRALQCAVRPFVGTLKLQYRMHHSLSRVPRELFYFGEALQDGKTRDDARCSVAMIQVDAAADATEENEREAAAIVAVLEKLAGCDRDAERPGSIMVITPYRAQEALLRLSAQRIEARLRTSIDVCTLDRCQGREADVVFISLVRNRATRFFDMPKRWNVALTRARQGLFIVGDIEAFRAEARRARGELSASRARGGPGAPAGETRPRMSVLARVVEAYDRQLTECLRPSA